MLPKQRQKWHADAIKWSRLYRYLCKNRNFRTSAGTILLLLLNKDKNFYHLKAFVFFTLHFPFST